MKAADESGQSTFEARYCLVRACKDPYFPVYFAGPSENLEIAARPLSCPPSVSAVESERHSPWRRANPPPIRKGLTNLILIQTMTRL